MSNNLVLKIENLSKTFFLHEQQKFIPSAENIFLEAFSGKITAITGESGVGKSSILKCVYGTYLASEGSIFYYTKDKECLDLATVSEQEMMRLRKTDISFVTQFLNYLPRKSTIDVVAKPLFDLGMDQKEAREKTKHLLAEIKLPERLWNLSPSTFSGGEKQRVNIARGMIFSPRLLLLDEPTASLDKTSAERVMKIIERIKASGTAILIILHDPNLVAQLADFEVYLSSENGQIISKVLS
ncbi:phosphonate C-P lyase system protein PhnL [Crocosphaera chwakensis]|uniref:ABC transporter related protein n=1 Tax=Crocosphaera chwakensis CCY0110 TaxID=391612 RepID=A3IUL8_9CHRO|nr:phosphonate C-P lyase system protein PhnL [Crocosphaera chwakensis]EAZ89810.1 ABC transporter related protein [Crocosphaera chwakensis CCY0110]